HLAGVAGPAPGTKPGELPARLGAGDPHQVEADGARQGLDAGGEREGVHTYHGLRSGDAVKSEQCRPHLSKMRTAKRTLDGLVAMGYKEERARRCLEGALTASAARAG